MTTQHRVFTFTDEWGKCRSYDLTFIIEAKPEGVGTAWEHGCEILAMLIRAAPHSEGRHARVKAEAYQRFKQVPVNKDASKGPVNPGTDTYFKDIWLAADGTYQQSRVERDQIKAMIEVLRQTYLPRLRMIYEEISSAEQNARSSQYSGMGRCDGSMQQTGMPAPPPLPAIS